MDLLPSALLSSLSSYSNFNISAVAAQPIMHAIPSLFLFGSLALQAVFAFPDPSRVKAREAELIKRSVDSFIAAESPIALTDLLCNIGAAGTCAVGAAPGIVIASPDKTNPNCMICYPLLMTGTYSDTL